MERTDINRDFIDEVVDCMSLDMEKGVSVGISNRFVNKSYCFTVTLPLKYLALFWSSLSFVYCDREHGDRDDFPALYDWSPHDLALCAQYFDWSSVGGDSITIYFPNCVLKP